MSFPLLSQQDSVNTSEKDLPETIASALETTGWFLLTNFCPDLSGEALNDAYLSLCAKVGVPIGHDRQGTLIWDIKSRDANKGPNAVVTYSEHNHEADLHTDSQYSSYPEDYFTLLSLKRASCGGGESSLLSLEDILAEMQETSAGREALSVLSSTDYPFIIPNVFRKNKQEGVEINFGPVFNNGQIRFRIDTMEKALAHDPSLCTERQLNSFNFLKNLVRNTTRINRFFLNDRDLIFINNKTMLHGRGSFTDSERHLLRIRMNKASYYESH